MAALLQGKIGLKKSIGFNIERINKLTPLLTAIRKAIADIESVIDTLPSLSPQTIDLTEIIIELEEAMEKEK